MKCIEKLKHKLHYSFASKVWHTLAPSFTVSRNFYGLKVYMNFRDNIDDFSKGKQELENREKYILDLVHLANGTIWDVGANVGLFSCYASKYEKQCVAFEISPKACDLLNKTKLKNNLSFSIDNSAFTIETVSYFSPKSANAENSFDPDINGDKLSCSYLEAEKKYGTPSLIKMDIEGGEKDFFDSKEFKNWIIQNEILLAVEIHKNKIGDYCHWVDIPNIKMPSNSHLLYCSNKNRLFDSK